MCGIVGLSLRDETDDAAPLLVEALFQLQHRGQDASGIATAHINCAAQCIKDNGLVGDAVASQLDSRSPGGPLGLGHGELTALHPFESIHCVLILTYLTYD